MQPSMSDHFELNDSDEDAELSPLEYARLNGLSRDHLEQPSSTDRGGAKMPAALLTDASCLTQFQFGTPNTTDTRLIVSKEAARLLASIVKDENGSDKFEIPALGRLAYTELKKLQTDLPLLKSHHETDCKQFRQRKDFEFRLRDVRLPLDPERECGPDPGPSLRQKDIVERLKRQRLEVSKTTFVHLRDCIDNSWTEEDERGKWAILQNYRKNTALTMITPPLSPMCQSPQPYEPSEDDPTFQLPVLSDPISLTKEDLDAIEEHIFNKDIATLLKFPNEARDRDFSEIYDSENAIQTQGINLTSKTSNELDFPIFESQRLKREDFIVEETLTPLKPSSFIKAVFEFSDAFMECPLAPTSSPSTEPLESSYFAEAFGDSHKKAVRWSEQERLIAADALGRVETPIMDFSHPDPPWKIVGQKNSARLLAMEKYVLKEMVGQSTERWNGVLKRDIKLRWSPFPAKLTEVAMKEQFIEDESTWRTFVDELESIKTIDASALTWKPPVMKILKHENDDEDEEIVYCKISSGNSRDLSSLVKKRKIVIQKGEKRELLPAKKAATDANTFQSQLGQKSKGFISAKQKLRADALDNGLLMSGIFSVGTSVKSYLEIRGKTNQELGDDSFQKKLERTEEPDILTNTHPRIEKTMPYPKGQPCFRTMSPLPVPFSSIPTTPTWIIVSSTLLKHRNLIKHIETSIPSLILVERNFDAHTRIIWLANSVARSPIASPLESEADFAVSPLVGVIITTLQKISQLPLPGQKTKSAIRERIGRVGQRYEKLIVLVTEGNKDDAPKELKDIDCISLCEFVGFTLSLKTTINVYFVGGGEQNLARWMTSIITQHCCGDELLADETHWELFLRRVGLNAFAAQSILATCRAPNSVSPSLSKAGQYGLSGIVEMGKEQRLAKFGPHCSKSVIETISNVIDARWD